MPIQCPTSWVMVSPSLYGTVLPPGMLENSATTPSLLTGCFGT